MLTVYLTAIRDLEILEFSLLRTLNQYLNPLDIRIIRVDGKFNLKSEITFGSEKCNVRNDDLVLSEDVRSTLMRMERIESSEDTLKNSSGYLSVYKVYKTNSTTLYLLVLNHDRISRENRHLLIGLLEIFRNYVSLLSDNITDSLTGLLNRKSFDRTIDKIYDLLPDDQEP